MERVRNRPAQCRLDGLPVEVESDRYYKAKTSKSPGVLGASIIRGAYSALAYWVPMVSKQGGKHVRDMIPTRMKIVVRMRAVANTK